MNAVELVKAYLAAVERFDVEGARKCLHRDILFTEQPNRLNPGGTRRTLEVMMEGLPRGAAILERQSYGIVSVFGEGDRVAVETRWEGILKIALGSLKPGEAMVAHIAMLFEVKDGLIWRQTNYDCYEAF